MAVLPPDAVLQGSSERTDHELWTIGERVLSMQSHPELNNYIVETLIINKLYDLGRFDDNLKNEALERTYDPEKPLTRNIMLKMIQAFLRS